MLIEEDEAEVINYFCVKFPFGKSPLASQFVVVDEETCRLVDLYLEARKLFVKKTLRRAWNEDRPLFTNSNEVIEMNLSQRVKELLEARGLPAIKYSLMTVSYDR